MKKLKSWILLVAISGLILYLGFISFRQSISLAADGEVLHVLNRLSFGATPGEVAQLKSSGIENYIKTQL